MSEHPSPSYREHWFPRLRDDEQAAVLELEAQIAEAAAALSKLRRKRTQLVGRGVGRARYLLVGQAQHFAKLRGKR